MNATELINFVKSNAGELAVVDDKLKFKLPPQLMTDELLGLFKKNKTDIISLLKKPEPGAPQAGCAPGKASYPQQRLWFIDQLQPGSTLYNMPLAFRLSGNLDIGALRRALNEVIRRHETLRTSFASIDGEPIQIVEPSLQLPLPLINLSMLPEEKREADARRLIETDLDKPFDLTQLPLIRGCLIKLSEHEYILSLTVHHIVFDGWSIGVLLHEIATLYPAFAAGKPSPLPEVTFQYADFSAWQQQWLQGGKLDQQLEYWKKQLADSPAMLSLPTDRPRPPVQSHRGARYNFSVPKSISLGFRELARKSHATLHMALAAAFNVLLYRYSGQQDICIGTPVANRIRREFEPLIGFFVNTLVLRSRFNGNWRFDDLLRQMLDTAVQAYANQDIPFGHIVEALNPERNLSRDALLQVMFIWQSIPIGTSIKADSNITLENISVDSSTAKLDLALEMMESDTGLIAAFEYSTDLFDAATIVRMARHFTVLLDAIVKMPNARLCDLPLLDEEERRQLLIDWNSTAASYRKDLTIHQLFESQAEVTPHHPAVIFEDQQITYGELNARANRLARRLRAMGIVPDSLVALYVERSIEMIVGVLAILKAGGAYLPLDPTYPPERIAYMVNDAKPALWLTQTHLRSKLDFFRNRRERPEVETRSGGVQMSTLSTGVSTSGRAVGYERSLFIDQDLPCLCVDAEWQLTHEAEANLTNWTDAQNLAYIIYTSGSTGRPKGVSVGHQGIVNRLLWDNEIYRLEPSDRILQNTPFSFDVSVWEFFWPLAKGATLVLARPYDHKDIDYLAQLINAQHITTVHFVPSMLEAFLQTVDTTRCETLRQVICGGEPLSGELQKRFFSKLKDVRLHNRYGPTETSIEVTHQECSSETGSAWAPIGRPVANTCIYLLDEHLNLVPVGVPGELYIAGDGLARGYLDRPELTADRFLPDPFSETPAALMYRSGDLARYRTDGKIEYIGRVDHQVKIRGFRIELGEIESALLAHPAIGEATVIVREDEPGDKRLTAYVVPREAVVTLNDSDIRAFLQESLPDHFVPTQMIFLERFPLTPNGKIDRNRLPKPAQQDDNDYVAPRTKTEDTLARIWAEVLKRERIGIHDNFFYMGGHSLLATSAISRSRAVFHMDIPLRALFESPTVAQFAQLIDTQQGKSSLSQQILLADRSKPLPLSFAQSRLWFIDRLEPGSPLYNMPIALRFKGELNTEALQSCLNELVLRHEALRTTFDSIDGDPIQVIASSMDLPLSMIELPMLPLESIEAEAQRRLAAEVKTPFDLKQGPLAKACLIRLHGQEHIFLLLLHHIIGDGWSATVLLREMIALYNAFSKGQPSPLPSPALQYADFAQWQREWLKDEVLDRQLNYWKGQLSHAPDILALPTDRPRPAIQTHRGARFDFAVPKTIAAELNALGKQTGTTLFMILVTAFNILLYRYSGQRDICVGTPIANRMRPEFESLVGFFMNTLVLRTRIDGRPCFNTLLKQMHETAMNAYAHQDLPFDHVMDAINPERHLSHTPLFQVMFLWQNIPINDLSVQSFDNKVNEAADSTRGLPAYKVQQNLVLEQVSLQNSTAKFDLSLEMMELSSELVGTFEYNVDLFDRATIERMTEHFVTLLKEIVKSPDACVIDLRLLTNREIEEQAAWNKTQQHYRNDQTLHELFEAQVTKTPNNIAVIFDNQQFTYTQLNARANQLARHLRAVGIGPEGLVGIFVERSLEMIVGILAVLKAGAAYLPLDPTYPEDRLAFMLNDAKPALLLTQQRLVGRLPANHSQVFCLDSEWSVAEKYSEQNLCQSALPDHLAYIIYTSGSTGKPKGVMIEHRNIVNFLQAMKDCLDVTSNDALLAVTSLSFDIAVLEIYLPLITGAHIVLASREAASNPVQLLALMRQHHVSVMQATPSTWRMVVEHGWPKHSIKVLCGGEALPTDLMRQLTTRAEKVWNLYGPTETTVWSAINCMTSDTSRVSIGRPIANIRMYLLDESLQPVPVGITGEIYIAGTCVGRGYLHRPDITANAFIPDPFSALPGERMYRSGDLARYLPNGEIEYLGRIDHQIKIRGFRIELGEIESALLACPGIEEAIVTAREDVPGDKRIVAYLVMADEEKNQDAEIRTALRQSLPDYMIPAHFVIMNKFPLTPNGKVDRKALPAPIIANEENHIEPSTDTEISLAEIWCDVLNLEKIGTQENFFEAGGNSLLSIRLLHQVGARLQVALPSSTIFKCPTIALLASAIDETKQLASSQTISSCDEPYLMKESILDRDIFPSESIVVNDAPKRILLTGATGFLGAFLLHEVLRSTHASIDCLVRADNDDAALIKVRQALQRYQLWDASFETRIAIVRGELDAPRLGLDAIRFDALARDIDAIIHNGAMVNFALPYDAMKGANVSGTRELLRLATRIRTKPVHYVSTISVFPLETNGIPHQEHDLGLAPGNLINGYAQSKWVAERLVIEARNRGIPLIIYRPGQITGHSISGIGNADDLLSQMIRACIELGAVPDLDTFVDITPVNYVSEAIAHFVRQPSFDNAVYHLLSPTPIHFHDLLAHIASLGYDAERMPVDQWMLRLEKFIADSGREIVGHPFSALLNPTLKTLKADRRQPSKYSCEKTVAALSKVGITCPPVTAELIQRYISKLMSST